LIKKIKINNFKAFNEEFVLNLENKNLLVYGDNGTGKSSLYEAFKIGCFKKRIINEKNLKGKTDKETDSNVQEFFSKNYNNSKNKIDYELILNNKELKVNKIEELDIDIFMIDYLINYIQDEQLELINFLKKQFFKNIDIKNINFKLIQDYVNNKLKEFQEENINIILEEEIEKLEDENIKKVWLKISDNQKELESRNIKQFFNEAKINLIILLLVFEVIKQTKEEGVIVLDDFITSLDLANKVFLIKYIFESFKEWQLIILTHNLEFFNLMKYIIDEKIVDFNNKWKFLQLYELNEKIGILDQNKEGNLISIIENKLKDKELDKSNIANMIRIKFENILHKISIDLLLGSIGKSDDIVKSILNQENIYLKIIEREAKDNTYRGANYILNEIEENIDNPEKIKEILDNARISKEKLDKIRNLLKEIKLYRKIILHPLSHNQAQFNIKELYKALELVKNLDDEIKGLL